MKREKTTKYPVTMSGERLEVWRDLAVPVTMMDSKEYDGLRRYGVRLMCPNGHGVQVVVERSGVDNGQTFTLFCGCVRGRNIAARPEVDLSNENELSAELEALEENTMGESTETVEEAETEQVEVGGRSTWSDGLA